MSRRTLVVLEGPAGSGKTTLMGALTSAGYCSAVKMPGIIDRPRAYEGSMGIQLSSVKDYMTAVAVVGDNRPMNFPLVADRWLVSQWVYGQIRLDQERVSLNPELVRRSIGDLGIQGLEFLNMARRELQVRSFRTIDWKDYPFQVIFVYVLPRPDVILAHRQQAALRGRQYPYNYVKEYEYYRQAFLHMTSSGPWKVYDNVIEAVQFTYVPEDEGSFYRSMCHLGEFLLKRAAQGDTED